MILSCYGLVDATYREKEEVRYRIIFEKDIRKRIFVACGDCDFIKEAKLSDLENVDIEYLRSMEDFIRLKPFSEAFIGIEKMPDELKEKDVPYVDLVIMHDWKNGQAHQIIYMETEKERTKAQEYFMTPECFGDYAWDIMPSVSMVFDDGKVIADFTYEGGRNDE